MSGALLEMRNISKVYPNGVVANKMFSSPYGREKFMPLPERTGGQVYTDEDDVWHGRAERRRDSVKGKQIKLGNPQDAIALGIGMVHQHFMLVPSFTVAENMVLGMEPRRGVGIHYAEAVRMTEETARKYNLSVNPRAKVEDLSVGMKQKVEILKALLRGAEILILDEPTAVLTPQETEELFRELKLLEGEGTYHCIYLAQVERSESDLR